MTQLIDPSDPRYFKQSSDKPYDRHQYQIVINKDQSIIFDDYDQLRAYWFEYARNWNGCKVNVLDVKQKNKKSTGGFKYSWLLQHYNNQQGGGSMSLMTELNAIVLSLWVVWITSSSHCLSCNWGQLHWYYFCYVVVHPRIGVFLP